MPSCRPCRTRPAGLPRAPDLDDLDAIRADATRAAETDTRSGVVIGGGLLGLEAANALRQFGLQAHIVERAPRLMNQQLDEADSALYRPAVLRANRIATATGATAAALPPPELRFHLLCHTYASLCAAVGMPVREVAKFMGHANTTTTEHIYTHLFDTDDHADAMAALDALDQPVAQADNVIPLHG